MEREPGVRKGEIPNGVRKGESLRTVENINLFGVTGAAPFELVRFRGVRIGSASSSRRASSLLALLGPAPYIITGGGSRFDL